MIELIVILSLMALAIGAAIFWLYVAPALARVRVQRALAAHCAASGTLCLTYDDGPGRQLTPELLNLLDSAGAKATFFLLGVRAQKAPDVADSVKNRGHDVGCHSCNHLNAWKSPLRSRADVQIGYQALAPWLSPGALFRPPHGKLTALTQRIARRHGSAIGWWTIDSGDTWDQLPDPDSIIEKADRAGGGVILMHDFDRDDDDASQRAEFVLALTRSLLDLAQRRNWRLLTLKQVMSELESTPRAAGATPPKATPAAPSTVNAR